MNFLAHLALAGPTDASRLGNILGDFEKGPPQYLSQYLPKPVVIGIMMHRHLDRFTDSHQAFLAARELLPDKLRRFAGIVVDIFFDHFLTKHWADYYPVPFEAFLSEIDSLFDRRPEWMGNELPKLLPRIREESWLSSYGEISGIERALNRLSQRSPRLAPLAESSEALRTRYSAFEASFHSFFPDAQTEASRLLALPPEFFFRKITD